MSEDKKPAADEKKSLVPAKTAPERLPVRPREIGGPKGLEPTRYGDWESNGRCSDF
jgi:hypothetical protein